MPRTARILAFGMGIVLALAAPLAATAQETQPQIVVQGLGKVPVAPDMARVSVGVTERADTAAQALAAMNTALAAVLERLRSEGIEDRHLQSGALHLHQFYENYDNTRKPAGYEASSTLTVQVYDLPKLGTILDAVVRDGANEMRGLTFDVADPRPHLDQARIQAVADAKTKAALYAQAAGVELGQVLLISEESGGARPAPMMIEASFDSAQARAVPVAEGELEISATINMIWALN